MMRGKTCAPILLILSASLFVMAGCGPAFEIAPFTLSFASGSGDFNRDGLTDFVIVHSGAGRIGYLAVFLQQPGNPGHFTKQTIISDADPDYAVAVQDLNGDGWDDIIVGCKPQAIAVYLQDPSNPGTYTVNRYSIGHNFDSIVIGDLNQDGRPDIAIAWYSSSGGGVTILFNDSAFPGRFLQSVEALSYGAGLGSIAVADFDGDGINDFAATCHTLGKILVYHQNAGAPGTFAAGIEISVGGDPGHLVARDLDGDGRADLVFRSGTNVDILLQNAANPGHFFPLQSFTVGSSADWIDVADLDGDGRLDIVTASYDAKNVTVLLQTPGTQFMNAGSYDCGDPAFTVKIADLNADGRPDLLVAASRGNLIFFQYSSNPGYFYNSGFLEPG